MYKFKTDMQQEGFILFLALFMLALSALLITTASQELQQSLHAHHIKIYKNCQHLVRNLQLQYANSTQNTVAPEQLPSQLKQECPKCVQGVNCL